MAWGIVAGAVAGPLIGGLMGKGASSQAADAQTQGARQSDATQRYQYDTTRADNAPFRENGLAANNRLAQLMGLTTSGGGSNISRDQLRAQLISGFSTPGTPGTPASQGVYNNNGEGVVLPENLPTPGTPGTPGAIDETGLSAAIEREFAKQQGTQTAQSSDPNFGSLSRNFSAADLAADPIRGTPNRMLANAAPGYMQPLHNFGQADLNNDLVYQNGLQFGLEQGAQGINRQSAAGGNFLSGATLKALTRFGNDYGTTKTAGAYERFTNDQNNRYTQATNDQNTQYGQGVDSYNRFNNNQDRSYNKLAGMTGTGQVATSQINTAGQNMANNLSVSQQGVGNARGSSLLTQGNALQNMVNGSVSALRNSGYGASPPGWGGGGGWTGGGRVVPDFAGAEY